MELPDNSLPTAVRVELAAINRYEQRGDLDATDAAALRAFTLQAAAPVLTNFLSESAQIANDRGRNAHGKAQALGEVKATARRALESLRRTAEKRDVEFREFDRDADRRVRDSNGGWRNEPPPQFDPRQQREIRDRLLARDLGDSAVLADMRRDYLHRVEQHGHDVFTAALENDPLGASGLGVVLDQRTKERAREARLARTGVLPLLRRRQLVAQVTSSVVSRIERELQLAAEPQPERVGN